MTGPEVALTAQQRREGGIEKEGKKRLAFPEGLSWCCEDNSCSFVKVYYRQSSQKFYGIL